MGEVLTSSFSALSRRATPVRFPHYRERASLKIKCNFPDSRPSEVSSPSGQTPRRRYPKVYPLGQALAQLGVLGKGTLTEQGNAEQESGVTLAIFIPI